MKNEIFVNSINFKDIRLMSFFLFVLNFCLSALGEGYLQMAY